MAQPLLLLIVFLAVAGLVSAVGVLLMGDRVFGARLSARLHGAPATAATPVSTLGPALLRTMVRWGQKAGRGALENESRAVLRLKLIQAGFYSERAAEAFFGIRATAAVGLAMLALAAVMVLHVANLVWIAVAVMLAANVGLFAPNVLLAQRIKARGEAIHYGLPDAIDLLVVSLEAGATLSAGLQRVQIEFRDLHPVLTEQFGILMMEMQAGASRAEALTRMAYRVPSEELKALTTMIVQSEAVGASLGAALRVFAEELRQTRYLEAERKAAELPVKLSFPLVLLIFPCLALVIFIPIILRFMHSALGHG